MRTDLIAVIAYTIALVLMFCVGFCAAVIHHKITGEKEND